MVATVITGNSITNVLALTQIVLHAAQDSPRTLPSPAKWEKREIESELKPLPSAQVIKECRKPTRKITGLENMVKSHD